MKMYRTAKALWLCCVSLLCTVYAEEEEHEEHWEWAGLFQVTKNGVTKNSFSFRNTGEENFTTFSAAFLITPCLAGDDEALDAAIETAELYFESADENNNATLISGNQVSVSINQVYSLAYSSDSWLTTVDMVFPEDGYYVILTEHHPTELCGSTDHHSCFRDQHGQEMTLLMEEGADGHAGHGDEDEVEANSKSDAWLYTMVGCFMCWSLVFSGLLFIVFGTDQYKSFSKNYLHLLNLFASGAILSTVLFLILLEASHYMSAAADYTEAEVSGMFGSAVLAGFISPTLIELLFFSDIDVFDVVPDNVIEMKEEAKYKSVHPSVELVDEAKHEADLTETGSNDGQVEKLDDVSKQIPTSTNSPRAKVNSIVISVICGDFLHNLCDGIFIGVAAKSCSTSLLWSIVFATMFHEFAQEISDFVVLTNKAGLSVPHALMLNAASGFSVVLGGVMTNLFEFSDMTIGVFLAYGSGTLIYLSAGELFPLLHVPPAGKAKLSQGDKLKGMMCFCLGAGIIGLTLLRHEHCEVSGDAHEGH
jgi:zinc transporter ZupT